MYDADTKGQFLELRAKGWSLARIAKRLKVAQRTLVDWNRQEQEQIRSLRAIELEALREKILRTMKQNCTVSALFLRHRTHMKRDCPGSGTQLENRASRMRGLPDTYRFQR